MSRLQSTFVVGLHLIIRGGIQVKVRSGPETIAECQEKIDRAKYGDDPVEIHSNEVLKACQVGLGCMGVIYSITYKCVPMYNLEEIRKTEQVSWPETTTTEDDESDNDGDDALMGKKLQLGEVLEKFAEMYKTKDAEYFSFFVNPYPLGPR